MIFDSNYFQAIQTAFFYKKSTFKMFQYNFFHVSRHPGALWPKQKWKLRKKILLKKGPKIFDKMNRLGLGIR